MSQKKWHHVTSSKINDDIFAANVLWNILIKMLFRFIGFVISWERSALYSRSLIHSNKGLTKINNTMFTVYFDFLETNASKKYYREKRS